MRVVAVAHFSIPDNRGGSELMLHELLKALVDAGHTVDLVVTDTEGSTVTVDGVRILRGRHHLTRLGQYDFGVTHHKETPTLARWAQKHRKPWALLVHSDLPYNRGFLALEPDLVVFNAHWVRKQHRWFKGRSIVVHPPVWGHEHATTRGDMVTLINPLPEKGAGTFYKLAARMKNTQFLVVEGGYGHDRQVRRDLPNVTWQPHTNNMRDDVWTKTRVLLMPSHYESWGMAGVEALHSGIPVIAAPTPGLRESLGSAGVFYDPVRIHLWEFGVRSVWDSDTAFQRALARARELDPAPQLAAWVKEVEGIIR